MRQRRQREGSYKRKENIKIDVIRPCYSLDLNFKAWSPALVIMGGGR